MILAEVETQFVDEHDLLSLSLRLAETPCGPLSKRHISPDRRFDAEMGSEIAPFGAILLRSEAAAITELVEIGALQEITDGRRNRRYAATQVLAQAAPW